MYRTFVLLTDGPTTKSGLQWVNIAHTGSWQGHRAGAFELTRERFDECVRNFRSEPRYQNKANHGRVVAYDLHHASEMPLSSPIEMTLAHAWVHELEVRPGASGRDELWALTEYLETAKRWVKGGHIAGVSGAFQLQATDAVSKKPIGCKLTSVAFTNQPFLTDLAPPIAASAANLPTSKETDMATSALLLAVLRSNLKLSADASEDDVVAAIAKGTPMTASAPAPTSAPAPAPPSLRDRLMSSLGLAVTATDDEICSAVDGMRKKDAEGDVREAIAAHRLDPKLQPMLLSFRMFQPADFAKAYPKADPAQQINPMLTSRVSDLVNGQAAPARTTAPINGVRLDSAGRLVLGGNEQARNSNAQEFAMKLLAVPGNNKHERAIGFVKAQPGGDKLTHEQAHKAACVMLTTHGIPHSIVDIPEMFATAS
jgi:hypothetical protein